MENYNYFQCIRLTDQMFSHTIAIDSVKKVNK